MRRRELTFFAAAFCPPFLLYTLTRGKTWALDTLYTIDSAEMVLASQTLGIDHPPGHPLYLILAHLFSLLPFAREDEGVIFCSVVAMALASVFLAQAIRLRTDNTWAGLGTGWVFAFGLVVWFHGTIAEVYAVQLAAVGACYALVAAWLKNRRPATFFALCFALGLTATTNILLATLLLPGLFYLTTRSGTFSRRFFPVSFIFSGLGFMILGATPFIYIPLRLGSNAFISDFVYLNGYEPGSLRWYFWYLSAEEFTTKINLTSIRDIPGLLLGYAGSYVDNHSPIFAILSTVGIITVFRGRIVAKSDKKSQGSSKRSLLSPVGPQPQLFERMVLVGFLATLIPVLPYQVADREVFYMPSFLHLVLLGGLGLWRVSDAIRHATFPDDVKPWITRTLALLAPVFLVTSHYSEVSSVTGDLSVYRDRESRFLALPENAIVTSTDDGRATRWKYWQMVRGLRPDVRIETLGRLAPRYRASDPDPTTTGLASRLAPSLNLADCLRVLKGLLAEDPERPLFAILDDRLPPELDHFKIRRSSFDSRLLRITDKPAPETSKQPIPTTILSGEDSFKQLDIIGIDIIGLDGGVSRAFPSPIPIQARVVNGLIQRSEFVEIGVSVLKKQAGQYFAEFVFVDEQMRIPSARGFTASRSIEIIPEDLEVGSYLKDRLTIKIPGFIPGGLHTLAVAIHAVTDVQVGTYKGKTLKTMVPLEAERPWSGQTRYQPLARIWIE